MRQQRTECSQGWVKVLAVLQTEQTLRGKILPFQDYVKYVAANCRCKMRMSGLSKVEMSAFIEPLR
jgi:hypothetical protein